MDRVKSLNNHKYKNGSVVYWMSRDQRVKDNWALIYANQIAVKNQVPLFVMFNIPRQYYIPVNSSVLSFMISGLKETEKKLSQLNIQFILTKGSFKDNLLDIIKTKEVGMVITDFSPLKAHKEICKNIANFNVPVHQVDAHNIIPVWVASQKQEHSARTIRSKINSLLPDYLKEIPVLDKLNHVNMNIESVDFRLFDGMAVDVISQNYKVKPGEEAAKLELNSFINTRLDDYDELRNDPSLDHLSNLSAYLHFGQISTQRVAIEIKNSKAKDSAKNSFLEELIVRRELAENYCYYNTNYNNADGAPNWAKQSLESHNVDQREYLYTRDDLERGKTHDDAWNAAQIEMVKTGKMHGYMRMYWAKKILEWTKSPEQAIEFAIYLNDKYSLDGRDPNGYVGIMWSIYGLHDRGWKERSVFGKVRYMNYNGLKRKFNIDNYIDKHLKA